MPDLYRSTLARMNASRPNSMQWDMQRQLFNAQQEADALAGKYAVHNPDGTISWRDMAADEAARRFDKQMAEQARQFNAEQANRLALQTMSGQQAKDVAEIQANRERLNIQNERLRADLIQSYMAKGIDPSKAMEMAERDVLASQGAAKSGAGHGAAPSAMTIAGDRSGSRTLFAPGQPGDRSAAASPASPGGSPLTGAPVANVDALKHPLVDEVAQMLAAMPQGGKVPVRAITDLLDKHGDAIFDPKNKELLDHFVRLLNTNPGLRGEDVFNDLQRGIFRGLGLGYLPAGEEVEGFRHLGKVDPGEMSDPGIIDALEGKLSRHFSESFQTPYGRVFQQFGPAERLSAPLARSLMSEDNVKQLRKEMERRAKLLKAMVERR